MAVSLQRVTVSTVAVALNTPGVAGVILTIANTTANAADLGTAAVAAGAGYPLAGNATITVTLGPGEQLFAIRTGATDTTLAVLRTATF